MATFPFGTRGARSAVRNPAQASKPEAQPAATPPAPTPGGQRTSKAFSFSGGIAAEDLGVPDFASTAPEDYESNEDVAPASAPARPASTTPAPQGGIPMARPTMVLPKSKPSGAQPSVPGGIPAQPAARFSFGSPSRTPAQRAAHAAQQQAPDELVGLLTDVRLYNDWGIGRVMDSSGSRVSVKGAALTGLQEGNRYKFSGKRSVHPKYGPQFEIVRAEPDIESIEAIVAHIQRNYKGAGLQTASAIAKHHRESGTLEEFKKALIHAPSSIDFTPFTSRQVTLRDDEDSRVRRVRDMLSIRLGGLGVAQNVIANLAEHLVFAAAHPDAVRTYEGRDLVSKCSLILDENPFAPIGKVERYGFQTADLIARQVGIQRDDPKRIAAVVSHSLREGCESGGHTWLGQNALFEAIKRLDYMIDPQEAIKIAIDRGEPIVIDTDFNSPRYYTKEMRRAEMNLAASLAMRMTQEVSPLWGGEEDELDDAIDEAVYAVGMRKGVPNYALDESQRAALIGIMTSTCSLHTLTAGPGCGKTTIVEVMMEVLGNRNTIFCAPTGKAAKVLNGRVSNWGVAKTIHSTLEYKGEFQRNADNPLDTELVVGDEQSMLGTSLGFRFFDAIPARAHVLMLGDPQQLDPIDAGSVLKAVLELQGLDHHRLTKTHRNDGDLLDVINEVGDGYCDARSRPGVEFTGSLPEPSESVFMDLADQVKEAAEKYGGLARVGVICPKRKGKVTEPGWNVTYLNAVLRDAINPDDEMQSKKVAGTSFRMGDRIIVTKNMWIHSDDGGHLPARVEQNSRDFDEWISSLGGDAVRGSDDDNPFIDQAARSQSQDQDHSDPNEVYVVNGDTGSIVGVGWDLNETSHKKLDYLVLQLDDDRTVRFPAAELDSLSLSYAITVHASQGSEYGKVFAINTDGHEQFMYRSMMFTQFSRSQGELKVYGDPKVLAKVAARPSPQRNCALVQQTLRHARDMISDLPAEGSRPRQREVA